MSRRCVLVPCPSGDDPWTANQVDEVQRVSCAATGGTFALTFRGETTQAIAASASTSQVEAALERLRTYVRDLSAYREAATDVLAHTL